MNGGATHERAIVRMDDVLERLSTPEIEQLLDVLEKDGPDALARALLSKVPAGKGADERVESHHRVYGFLSLLSNDLRSRRIWSALTDNQGRRRNRPEIVLGLWRYFEREPGRQYLEQWHRGLAYHRRHLFDWFLTRYDLGRARAVLTHRGGSLLRAIHLPLLAAMLLLAVLQSTRPLAAAPLPWIWLVVAALYLLAAGLQVLSFLPEPLTASERWLRAGQTLVPRLAAASVVGLVILASSEELLTFVVGGSSWRRTAVLLLASFLYVLLEMSQRIQPLPPPGRLLRLGVDVSAIALTHGLAIALCAERALRSIPCPDLVAFDFVQLVNVAAFLLTIGVIVNLIWAQEPVTQPL